MKIILEKITMKNFEGFKEKEINFSINTKISGPNESGKSGVADAFTWLLFDKDSNYNSTFDLKPQDEFGNDIHRLETVVEGLLTVDGESLTLKKIYYEKWVKPHGEKEEVFKGNTTDYFIDSVPTKKKDYDAKINELVKEDIFKLLTNPAYFNTEYHWEDRRKVLDSFGANLSDEEIINNNDNLSHLKKELEKFKSIDDFNKTVAYQKKKYKKKIKDIPARIDELQRGLVDVPMSKKQYEEIIEDANKGMSIVENKILDSSSIYDANEKISKEISELKTAMSTIKYNDQQEKTKTKRDLISKKNHLEDVLSTMENQKKKDEKLIVVYKQDVKTKSDRLNELRKTFKEIQQPIDFDQVKTECPTCGQHLPTESIEQEKEKLQQNHIKNIQIKKEKINKEASLLNDEVELLQEDIDKLSKKVDASEKEIKKVKSDLEELSNKIDDIGDYEFVPTEEYKNLQAKIKSLEEKKEQPNENYINELKTDKKEYQDAIDSAKGMILTIQSNDRSRKRIDELESEKMELASKIAELEGKEYSVETFNRIKAEYTEKIVNSEFDSNIVQFRLFEEQVNGGLKEVCTTMVRNEKGILVSYDSANTAGQVNAGLAIINKLSEHYDFYAPIFIDNAEGVNEVYETDSQHIELCVTDKGTEFKVLGKYENEDGTPKQLGMDLGV